MPWAVAAAVGGALIGADSSRKAANTQADATRDANKVQWDMYQQQREDAMPAMEARNKSLAQLQKLLLDGGEYGKRIDVGDITNEAGYQFGMQQGQSALNNQLAARGMRNSGAALKAAARFGNDYGSTKYDQAFNREIASRSAVLNPLQSLGGLAQTGIAGLNGAAQNYGNNVSNNALQLGNARAASAIAQGQQWTNALSQLGGWYGGGKSGSSGGGADVLGSWGDWGFGD